MIISNFEGRIRSRGKPLERKERLVGKFHYFSFHSYTLIMLKQLLFITLLMVSSGLYAQEIEHAHSAHHAFMENKGQWNSQVLFRSRFEGGNLWVQQRKFFFHLQDHSVIKELTGKPKKD